MCPEVVRLFVLRAVELVRWPGIRPPPPGDTPTTQTSGRPADAEQDASRWQNWKQTQKSLWSGAADNYMETKSNLNKCEWQRQQLIHITWSQSQQCQLLKTGDYWSEKFLSEVSLIITDWEKQVSLFKQTEYHDGSPGSQGLDLTQQLSLTHVTLHHLQQGGAQLGASARHTVLHQPSCPLIHLQTDTSAMSGCSTKHWRKFKLNLKQMSMNVYICCC